MQPQDVNSRATPAGRVRERARPVAAGAGPQRHPSSLVIAQFLLGEASPGTALLISRHSGECPTCWSKLLDMGGLHVPHRECATGAWTPLGAGLQVAPLQGVCGIGEAVYALRAEGGAQLSSNAPLRVCELLITDGGLVWDGARYESGDFLSFDDEAPALISAVAETGFSAYVTSPAADETAGEA